MFRVEKFVPQAISGVMDKLGVVELFVGDALAETTVSAFDAGRTAFAFSFANPCWPMVGARPLTVRANGYLHGPDIAEEVVGYFPRRHDLGKALDAYYGHMTNYPDVPQELIEYIGSGAAGQAGYRSIGYTLFREVLAMTGFRATDRVLDIGAGVGRLAMAFAPYLQGGSYLGMDTWQEGIAWAGANIQPLFPASLRFQALPSPPQGRRRGYLADYVAPLGLEEASFDLAVCTSLFAHLRESACVGYFEQIARVLRPDGLAFVTASLIRRDEADYFRHRNDSINEEDSFGFYVVDDTYCKSFIYADNFLTAAETNGLKVCRYSPGVWIGEHGAPSRIHGDNFQDAIVLRKA